MCSGWRSLTTLVRLSVSAGGWDTVFIWIGSGFNQLVWLGSIAGVKYLIDGAIERRAREAVVAAVLMGSLAFVNLVINRWLTERFLTAVEKVGRRLDEDLIRAAAGVPSLEHLEKSDDADRITILREERRRLAFTPHVIQLVVSLIGVQLVGSMALLAAVHPLLLLLPAFGLLAFLAHTRAQALVNEASSATAARTRLRQELLRLVASASAAKELRVFGAGEAIVARQQAVGAEIDEAIDRATVGATLWRCAGGAAFAIGYVAAVAAVLQRALDGQATAGDVVFVITLGANVNRIVASAAEEIVYLSRSIDVGRNLVWLLDSARAATSGGVGTGAVPERSSSALVVDRVSFRYPGGDTDVLDGVSLELTRGRVVALVGENGSGKTTLVKLLLRMYEPCDGRITLDGTDLRSYDPATWRERTSAAFQDFCRFELIVRETIGVGDVTRIDDTEVVSAAVSRAGAEGTVAALGSGLETQLGAAWKGSDLSSGQWQKLALARSMMRPLPLLCVFDEPTAILDPQSEHDLFARLAGVSSGRTITLLVSHRFSTVRMADHIVVLEHGRVAEQGTHDELLRRGGLYAELYGLHARAYQ